MGSSIKRYLWLQCGMFRQILALSVVLISPGERSRENELILCLHHVFYCCSPLSLCICSVMGTHVYSLLACHALVSGFIWPPLSFSLIGVFSPVHVRYRPFTPLPPVWSARSYTCTPHTCIPCDSACDGWRTCDRCSEGSLVDTGTKQGSFLLPRL